MRFSLFVDDSVSSGVIQPWVLVGTSQTGLHVQHLAGNLVRGQFAPVGDQALGSWPGVASLLPRGVVGSRVHINGLLDPLDDLSHGDEVGVLVVAKNLVDPVQEGVSKLGVVLQPGGMVKQAKRSSVLIKMSVEIVS